MQNHNLSLFTSIVDDLQHCGYSIQRSALPVSLGSELYEYISRKNTNDLKQAGVGRNDNHAVNRQIRSDHIEWLDNESQLGKQWLAWVEDLRVHINRNLFMGLDYFESHYACYPPGAYYHRHKDAFVGQSNRLLSLVAYLNPDWKAENGGELVLYESDEDRQGRTVVPEFGTLVLFLSEEFPHEVRIAREQRYSIAGWFRARS